MLDRPSPPTAAGIALLSVPGPRPAFLGKRMRAARLAADTSVFRDPQAIDGRPLPTAASA